MSTALKVALTGLFMAATIALSAGSLSAAEEDDGGNGNGDNGNGNGRVGVSSIPIFGHPYASQRSGGGTFFVGTIDLDLFEVDGDQITVMGRLLTTEANGQVRARETVFPVEIHDASCEHFILEIGPPPVLGLQDPLFIIETVHESQMRTGDFCTLARALREGDLETVLFELNEVEEHEAGLIGENSCDWSQQQQCDAARDACCSGDMETCFICLGDLDSGGCADCME